MEIFEACSKVNGIRAKLRIVFGHPAVMDQEIRPALESKYLHREGSIQYRFKFRNYLNIQITLSILLLFLFTGMFSYLEVSDKIFVTTFILLTLINCGALMEQRKWIYYLEYSRLGILFLYIFWKFDHIELILLWGVIMLNLEYAFRLRHLYFHYILRYDKA